MKIAIIGATGFTGSEVVKEALARGHQVTAISRNANKLPEAAQLTRTSGDIFDTEWLSQQLAGQDAVVSAFNNDGVADQRQQFAAANQSIISALKQAGTKRFLAIGGAGSLEIAPGVDLVDTPDFPAAYLASAQGARALRNTLRQEQELDWTYLSPAILLVPGERTGTFTLGTTKAMFNGDQPSTISTADLAVAIINELEKPQFIRAQFTLTY